MPAFLFLGLSLLGAPAAGTREGDVAVAEGVRLHYVEGGDSGAQAIVFIPGWSFSAAVWSDQLARFAPRAHVVSFDPRSQGQSTITPQSNSPEQRAQDLHRALESLQLDRVALVGWSQGVQDVAAYAEAFAGDRIAGYVLVDAAVAAGPAAQVTQPDALRQQLERFALYEEHPREYLEGMMNFIIHSPQARRRIGEFVQIGLRTPPDLGLAMLMMDFVVRDRRPALAKFNRPALVIASAESGELEAQREMARKIRHARFETVANAGHAVFLDQPDRFEELLAGFVKTLAR